MLSCLVTIKSSYHIQFNAAYPWPVFEVLFWLLPGGTDENPLKIISYSSHYQIMHLPNVREPHCCQANLFCVCVWTDKNIFDMQCYCYRVGAQGNPCTMTISDLLCIPI
jgi:hypothetical protein